MPLLLLLLLLAPAAAPQSGDDVTDESTPEYRKALELWKKGQWTSAQKTFRSLLDKYPFSVHAREIEVRSDDNCYLGVAPVHRSGPAGKRIDVAVMGDGFTIDPPDQSLEEKWAKLCVDVLFNEKSFAEYREAFNVYFVRLASLEEGVDPQLSEAERARIEERNRRRVRKRKTDYSTALDCKAAGPQNQVMADPGLVMRWLDIADGDLPGCGEDRLVIAFARFGVLGMGGGGIANVGRPDKSITVHEFGHAFTGLEDEYAVNPNPPDFPIRAANAATTSDPMEVPWKHFLKAKVPEVGIFEGGATHQKGVWRPARTCAMNSAGATQFCPVCREANVLAIYSFLNPIDDATPDPAEEVRVAPGGKRDLVVVPFAPRTHELTVEWWVAPLPDGEPLTAGAPADSGGAGRNGFPGGFPAGLGTRGPRAGTDRAAYGAPPPGERSALAKDAGGKPRRSVFPAGSLASGRWLVTAEAKDSTPWVLQDPDHLLVERVCWRVSVAE
jgi:hypothetical protein